MGKRATGKKRKGPGKRGGDQGRYSILRPKGKKWTSVFKQLYSSWRHPNKKKPSRVIRIIGVTPPRYLVARYTRYRDAIAKRHRLKNGNERRRWHGTKANCKFFRQDLRQTGRCNDKSCAICSIINTGFRLPKANPAVFQRYGLGVYFSSTSSKSDDYSGPKNPVRALFLCKVCVGRGKKMYADSTKLTRPPRGYDSVLGERSNRLNYDEVVVYNPAAALPAYVVIYG